MIGFDIEQREGIQISPQDKVRQRISPRYLPPRAKADEANRISSDVTFEADPSGTKADGDTELARMFLLFGFAVLVGLCGLLLFDFLTKKKTEIVGAHVVVSFLLTNSWVCHCLKKYFRQLNREGCRLETM